MMTKAKNNIKTVKLSTPIVRGENSFDEIQVMKPNVPALRGLKLLDVLQSDINALEVLLPRVTQPMLHKADFEKMEPQDFIELATAVLNFLAPTSDSPATLEMEA